MPLQEFVLAAQQGRQEAFQALIECCRPRIEALLRTRFGFMLQRKLELEDLVQETFLSAWKAIGNLEWQGEPAFWGWIEALSVRVVQGNVRRLQTRKRSVRREMSLQALDGEESKAQGPPMDVRGASPSQVARREERFERLKEALRHLTPDYRKVVFQVCLQNMAIKDVAAAMGRSPGAVSMLLFRALRQLKESFGITESLSLPKYSLEDALGDDEDSDDAGR